MNVCPMNSTKKSRSRQNLSTDPSKSGVEAEATGVGGRQSYPSLDLICENQTRVNGPVMPEKVCQSLTTQRGFERRVDSDRMMVSVSTRVTPTGPPETRAVHF